MRPDLGRNPDGFGMWVSGKCGTRAPGISRPETGYRKSRTCTNNPITNERLAFTSSSAKSTKVPYLTWLICEKPWATAAAQLAGFGERHCRVCSRSVLECGAFVGILVANWQSGISVQCCGKTLSWPGRGQKEVVSEAERWYALEASVSAEET